MQNTRAVPRRTKIVATLGPATESDEAIDALIKAGVDVVRLNFSHGTADEHRARAEKIRRIGLENNRHLAIEQAVNRGLFLDEDLGPDVHAVDQENAAEQCGRDAAGNAQSE